MKRIVLFVIVLLNLAVVTVYAFSGNLMSELITDKVYSFPNNVDASYFLTNDVVMGIKRDNPHLYIHLYDVVQERLFELRVDDVQDSTEIYKTQSIVISDNKVLLLITEYKNQKQSYDHYIYVIDYEQFKMLDSYQYNEYFGGINEEIDKDFEETYGSNYSVDVFYINDELAYLCGIGLWSLNLKTGETQLVLTSNFAENKKDWDIEYLLFPNGGPGFYGISVIDSQLLFRCHLYDSEMKWIETSMFNSVLCTIDERGKVKPVNDKELESRLGTGLLGVPEWQPLGIIDERYIVLRQNRIYDFELKKMYKVEETLMVCGNDIYAFDKKTKCLSIWSNKSGVKKYQIPIREDQKVEMFVPPAENANSIFFYTYEVEGENYFDYSTNESDWYRYDLPNQKISLVMPKDENAQSNEDIIKMIDSYCGGLLLHSTPYSYIDAENNGDRYELTRGSVYRRHWEYWSK